MPSPLILHLRFARSFWRVVRDPTRTQEIFKVITHPYILNRESLDAVQDRLMSDPESRRMIESRFSGTWSLDDLLRLPPESFGHVYAKHMRDNGLDVDFYPPVPGETVDAYIQLRLRQTHDIWHILTGFDTSVPAEAGLQAFLQAQTNARSPSLIMAMFLLHAALYRPSEILETTQAISRGWAMGRAARPLFGQKFEDGWTKNLQELRRELNLA